MQHARKGRYSRVPEPEPVVPTVFNVHEQDSLQKAREHLSAYGYVVFGNVLSPEEIEVAQSLYWDYMEGLGMLQSIQSINSSFYHLFVHRNWYQEK